jgi:hypothetical protein
MRASLLALGVAALAACASDRPRPSGFGPAVRICDERGCSDRPTATAAVVQPEDRRGTRQSDPDVYRGEDAAALQAAAEGGDARAAYLLGQVHEYGLAGRARRPAEAARWYGVAAEAGNAWAQFRLAQLLNTGAGVPRDRARALRLTLAAAESGHARAAHNAGTLYLSGQGVPRDAGEGLRWLTVAAENGVPEAQYNLGLMHYRGEGAPRRLHDALVWMRQAAQNGYAPAQKAVGRLYMTGLDTMGQDLAEARTWLTPVAAAGDREAQGWLREMDRAEREERDFRRALQMQQAETQSLWAAAALATMLAPPVVIVPW